MLNDSNQRDNLFNILARKIFPFWPLFMGLFLLAFLASWGYLFFTTPKYQITAALIVNDEKKGVDESKIIESIDVFTSKKIVENEVEVLGSKKLISEVVEKLSLYAPVYEDKFLRNELAYQTSPIWVKLKNPSDDRYYGTDDKHEFVYYYSKNSVRVNNKSYPLDEWLKNPFGGDLIKFVKNPHYQNAIAENPFYFQFIHPKIVVNNLYRGLYVGSSSKLSTVVRIDYTDPVTKRGEDLVNTLIDVYLQSSIREKDTLAANTLAFVEDRMTEVSDELIEVEKELEQYRSNEGVVNLSEQGNLYLRNVGDYDNRINDIQIQLDVLRKVEGYVISKRKSKGIVPSTLGLSDPILSSLLKELYDTEIEYEQLRKTTGENNPILLTLRNKIDNIRPSILENVRNQKSSLQASLSNLSNYSGKYNSALQLLPEQERRLVEISRKKKSISQLYDFLAKKREETALSYAPQKSEARIIEPAESSLHPVSPKKLFVFLISLLTATVLGILIVFGKELFSSKVLFRSDIENFTNIPVLGELSELPKKGESMLVNTHQDVFSIDQFRNLISNLGLYLRSNKTKTFMVTSNMAGEGKSYVSANLAQTIAFSGQKVALLDVDLRNAQLTTMFNLEGKLGISHFLTKEADYQRIIHKTDCAELSVIPCGKKTRNSSELLASRKLEDLFHALYRDFDYILIDTPPISLVSDASILADFTDKTLLVVKHDYTPKYVLKRLENTIKSKNIGTDCSIIFNGIKQRGMVKENYGYGHGYGYDIAETPHDNTFAMNLKKLLYRFKRS